MISAGDVIADVSYKLHEAWRSSGIEQRALAQAAGTSQGQVSALLTGRRENPSIRSIARLAAALGCWVQVQVFPRPTSFCVREFGPAAAVRCFCGWEVVGVAVSRWKRDRREGWPGWTLWIDLPGRDDADPGWQLMAHSGWCELLARATGDGEVELIFNRP